MFARIRNSSFGKLSFKWSGDVDWDARVYDVDAVGLGDGDEPRNIRYEMQIDQIGR